jgi:hypothetical protein
MCFFTLFRLCMYAFILSLKKKVVLCVNIVNNVCAINLKLNYKVYDETYVVCMFSLV